MDDNVHYPIFDNWYLTKYAELRSNDIDTISANMECLFQETKTYRDERIQYAIRDYTLYLPHGPISYTDDNSVADGVFVNGYRTTKKRKIPRQSYDHLIHKHMTGIIDKLPY